MTLVEELEQAASLFENTDVEGSMNRIVFDSVAAKLRARAKKVSGLERPACQGSCEHADCFLYRALTGDLPAATPVKEGT